MKIHLFQLIFVLKLAIKWAAANQNSGKYLLFVMEGSDLSEAHICIALCKALFNLKKSVRNMRKKICGFHTAMKIFICILMSSFV